MRTERATAERGSTPLNPLIRRLLQKIGARQIACSTCTARATSIRSQRPLCATCARLARQRH
jgi:formate dehydrogenase maturation protein FdhE